MISTNPSEQRRYRPGANSLSPQMSLLHDGGRVLLLAAGGFAVVHIAIALLQLG